MQVFTIALFLIQKQPIVACLVRMTSVTSSPVHLDWVACFVANKDLVKNAGEKQKGSIGKWYTRYLHGG